jgi:CRP/FNR family transcriptional regulator, cyclic AMP receptor protein
VADLQANPRVEVSPLPPSPELLRKVSLFDSLSDRDIKRLADALTERIFSAGDVILTEGERGVGIGFYVIGEGTVNYRVDGKDVGSSGPGDYFGEIALIEDRPRAATVTAATDVTVYVMTRWEFRALAGENADIASRLQQVMAQRLRTQN